MEYRIPLCVPYMDRIEALETGALIDENNDLYIPEDYDVTLFIKWLPRMFNPLWEGPVLVPDMLPIATWQQNVRHLYGGEAWDRIRKNVYIKAGYRCEICGAKGMMEAHEHWELDEQTQVQKLTEMMGLCPLCHKVHHLGIAKRLGMLPEVKRHMQKVNGWTAADVERAISIAYEIWHERCKLTWTVDLSYLERHAILHANKNGLGNYEIPE